MHSQIDPVIDSFSLTSSLTDNTIRQTNQMVECVSTTCVCVSVFNMAGTWWPDIFWIATNKNAEKRLCNRLFYLILLCFNWKMGHLIQKRSKFVGKCKSQYMDVPDKVMTPQNAYWIPWVLCLLCVLVIFFNISLNLIS